ncbi:hypothetical protein GCM10020331_066700 [Ectobacillus funiculus]
MVGEVIDIQIRWSGKSCRKIVSVGICKPPYSMTQEAVVAFAKEMFSGAFSDIQRLLQVFQNGQIETRNFAKDLSWFQREHTWKEKKIMLI